MNNQYVLLVIIAVVVVRFLVRELRPRRLNPPRMLAPPLIVVALAVFFIATASQAFAFETTQLLLAGLAGIVGGIIVGAIVLRTTNTELAPDGKALIVRGSWITVCVWVGAFALRLLGRFFIDPHNVAQSFVLNSGTIFMAASALATVGVAYFQRFRRYRASSVPI